MCLLMHMIEIFKWDVILVSFSAAKLSIPNLSHVQTFDCTTTPPLTPSSSATVAGQVSSSTSDLVSPTATTTPLHHFSPTVSPRAHLLHGSSPQSKLVPYQANYSSQSPTRPGPNYHAVTAAKENQVVMTPPGSITSHPSSKDVDRDTSSPYSDLSDESVISVSMRKFLPIVFYFLFLFYLFWQILISELARFRYI